MPSYNRVILIGRLTREPELKYTSGGLAVTTFSIAVDRRFKNQQGERQTDFFRCKAWRQKAEFVANYVTKGRLVAVDGSIETSEVTGQDGQKRYFTDIVCENVEILESQRDNEGGPNGGPGGAQAGGNAGGNYGGGNASGGNAARGQNAPPVDDGGGYFPDEDAAPAAPPATPRNTANARPQGSNQGGQGGGNAGGNQGGARGNAGGASNRPAPTPAPAYPEDDFDDSDPFADQ